MSDLFTQVVKKNPQHSEVLALLGLTPLSLGRYRDAYLSPDGTKGYVFHRNYGPAGKEVDDFVANHPGFVRKFYHIDETYQTYEFNVPADRFVDAVELASRSETRPSADRLNDAIERVKRGELNDDDRAVFARLKSEMEKAVESNQVVSMINLFGPGEPTNLISPFAETLRVWLDVSHIHSRKEWAAFFGVSQQTIDAWVMEQELPSPSQLNMLYTFIERCGLPEQQKKSLIELFDIMAKTMPSVDASPKFGKRMLPTVWEYMKRPLFSELSNKLAKLTPSEQEELLAEMYPEIPTDPIIIKEKEGQ